MRCQSGDSMTSFRQAIPASLVNHGYGFQCLDRHFWGQQQQAHALKCLSCALQWSIKRACMSSSRNLPPNTEFGFGVFGLNSYGCCGPHAQVLFQHKTRTGRCGPEPTISIQIQSPTTAKLCTVNRKTLLSQRSRSNCSRQSLVFQLKAFESAALYVAGCDLQRGNCRCDRGGKPAALNHCIVGSSGTALRLKSFN